jgi:heme-degrading monooxygenase HmoA
MLIDISGNPAITDHHERPPGPPVAGLSEVAGLDDPLEERLGAGVAGLGEGTDCGERHPFSRSRVEGGAMIARIWKGAVRQRDGDAYARYMQETGVAAYARTPGNRGVWMLRRDRGDRTEFVMFTLWDSLEAVRAFAGEDYETAVFYPEDERFLVERDLTATHYQVDTQVATGSG